MNSEPNRFQPCSDRADLGTTHVAYACVRCPAYAGPSALLCPPCYAATRTGRRLAAEATVCPGCGGRLAAGKCGWC